MTDAMILISKLHHLQYSLGDVPGGNITDSKNPMSHTPLRRLTLESKTHSLPTELQALNHCTLSSIAHMCTKNILAERGHGGKGTSCIWMATWSISTIGGPNQWLSGVQDTNILWAYVHTITYITASIYQGECLS